MSRSWMSLGAQHSFLAALAVVAGLAMPVIASEQACEGQQKVFVCHRSKAGDFHTLRISSCALQSHLTNHADFPGPCENNCNVENTCDDGNACTTDECDASTGQCLHSPVDCDDGNPCTAESCQLSAGGCVAAALTGEPCDDADSCSAQDVCTAAGICRGTPLEGCCQANTDCDDGNLCTLDTCDSSAQTCRRVDRSCEDGDRCTVDTCSPQTGECISAPVACEAGSTCDPGTGVCLGQDPCASVECGSVIVSGVVIACPNTCAPEEICSENFCIVAPF